MNRGLYLVTLVKQPHGVILLELVVVLIGARPKLDFLDGDKGLFCPGFFLLLLLFVLIFTEVNDPTDRRLSLRRNLDKVEPFAARDFDRLLRRHYAELGSVLIDYANLANPYSLVDTNRGPAIASVSESSSRLKAADSVSSSIPPV